MNTKLITFSTSIILSAILLLPSCDNHGRHNIDDTEPTVDVALPVTDSITLTSSYPGYLTAKAKVDVVGRVSGQLLSKNFTNGQFVEKGSVLYRIEDSKYRDAVQQARAALATAQSSRDYAQSHYNAVKKALESDAVSKMEVIQAESDLRQAEASIKNAQAALETASINLGYCTVIAPISGYVTSSSYDPGSYINGEGSPVVLTTLYDNSTLTAQFSIEDERLIEILRNGDYRNMPELKHVELSFSDTIGHKYYGDLSYVAPMVDTSTGTVALQCKIENTYNELRPGMFVKVNLPYQNLEKAILVRDASLSTDQLGKYLYVVNDSDRIVYTPVSVGPLCHDSMRVVLSGIRADSRYVTKALLKVRNGMQVKPVIVK